mmetsp:Transcript_33926/g.41032  ORF Transcript_33926/g.41032 Transcript_33926/m.41032 type:complete len:312 (+) Transcript_33926:123-1058(+)|eukprot:CAMPEP_0197847700 /NCGR_PEP_ID=MMETSP1438-20131217/6856_1 /TAXON_ID=1461541 /ORGANISM="Pterosperma sp., Strain CCMP1384" /LENGTH=311 /DNA_ID=CAMNT_0043459703 /DNA_START=108 /DNA_END=1043 /DNA_ORIENTATION=-
MASTHPTIQSTSYKEDLLKCRDEMRVFIDKMNCAPIMLRLAWHDAGTYDHGVKSWPECGGANGSIRFDKELEHGANAGLSKAMNFINKFKKSYPRLSFADLIQLGGAIGIEVVGGPICPMKYGRVDTTCAEECPAEGNLPGATPPFDDRSASPAEHLRKVFHRMGRSDQDIVALSGAHTIGRAFKERSGTVPNGYGEAQATKFTCPMAHVRKDAREGVGMAGGKSWTEKWLTFDNSYFKYKHGGSGDLLWLPTDDALRTDESFKVYYETYAADSNAFFRDFAQSFTKLSEQGSKFNPVEGIYLDCPYRSKL